MRDACMLLKGLAFGTRAGAACGHTSGEHERTQTHARK